MRSLSIALFLVACGGSSTQNVDAPKAIDGPRPIDAVVDVPVSVDAPNPDQVINLAGGSNALLWDAPTSTLYITDSNANTLLKYTDANGVQTLGTWPADTAGVSLGGMLKQTDGSIIITNFGFGTMGSLFSMPAGGGTGVNITGLDATHRRVPLSRDSNGVIYEGYFTGSGSTAIGGVGIVTITGTTATETEVVGSAAALGHVVGLVATPTAIYFSDQTHSKIMTATVPGFTVTALATVTTADLLVALPNGDMLTGGGTTIERITQAGVVTTLPNTGFAQARGIAYDAVGHRLFILDHSTVVGVPEKLHIQPFTP